MPGTRQPIRDAVGEVRPVRGASERGQEVVPLSPLPLGSCLPPKMLTVSIASPHQPEFPLYPEDGPWAELPLAT